MAQPPIALQAVAEEDLPALVSDAESLYSVPDDSFRSDSDEMPPPLRDFLSEDSGSPRSIGSRGRAQHPTGQASNQGGAGSRQQQQQAGGGWHGAGGAGGAGFAPPAMPGVLPGLDEIDQSDIEWGHDEDSEEDVGDDFITNFFEGLGGLGGFMGGPPTQQQRLQDLVRGLELNDAPLPQLTVQEMMQAVQLQAVQPPGNGPLAGLFGAGGQPWHPFGGLLGPMDRAAGPVAIPAGLDAPGRRHAQHMAGQGFATAVDPARHAACAAEGVPGGRRQASPRAAPFRNPQASSSAPSGMPGAAGAGAGAGAQPGQAGAQQPPNMLQRRALQRADSANGTSGRGLQRGDSAASQGMSHAARQLAAGGSGSGTRQRPAISRLASTARTGGVGGGLWQHANDRDVIPALLESGTDDEGPPGLVDHQWSSDEGSLPGLATEGDSASSSSSSWEGGESEEEEGGASGNSGGQAGNEGEQEERQQQQQQAQRAGPSQPRGMQQAEGRARRPRRNAIFGQLPGLGPAGLAVAGRNAGSGAGLQQGGSDNDTDGPPLLTARSHSLPSLESQSSDEDSGSNGEVGSAGSWPPGNRAAGGTGGAAALSRSGSNSGSRRAAGQPPMLSRSSDSNSNTSAAGLAAVAAASSSGPTPMQQAGEEEGPPGLAAGSDSDSEDEPPPTLELRPGSSSDEDEDGGAGAAFLVGSPDDEPPPPLVETSSEESEDSREDEDQEIPALVSGNGSSSSEYEEEDSDSLPPSLVDSESDSDGGRPGRFLHRRRVRVRRGQPEGAAAGRAAAGAGGGGGHGPQGSGFSENQRVVMQALTSLLPQQHDAAGWAELAAFARQHAGTAPASRGARSSSRGGVQLLSRLVATAADRFPGEVEAAGLTERPLLPPPLAPPAANAAAAAAPAAAAAVPPGSVASSSIAGAAAQQQQQQAPPPPPQITFVVGSVQAAEELQQQLGRGITVVAEDRFGRDQSGTDSGDGDDAQDQREQQQQQQGQQREQQEQAEGAGTSSAAHLAAAVGPAEPAQTVQPAEPAAAQNAGAAAAATGTAALAALTASMRGQSVQSSVASTEAALRMLALPGVAAQHPLPPLVAAALAAAAGPPPDQAEE